MADAGRTALRVSQLDASELDTEIFSLTKGQLNKLFKYQQTNFLANFEPEIDAGLKLLIWKFTVNVSEATIGQNMLNLKYLNERAQSSTNQWISSRQKILYACLLIGCPWLKDRSPDLIKLLGLEKWKDKIDRALHWLETGVRVAALANFLMFLRQGRYRTLTEWLLGVRSVFPQRQAMRQVTFEYMTRELLWHGFSEFLFFVLPLINFQHIRNFVLRKILPSAAAGDQVVMEGRSLTVCATCGEWPIRAQEIGCQHVFCYFCIQSQYKADPSYSCPLCQHRITDQTSIQPVRLTDHQDSNEEDDR